MVEDRPGSRRGHRDLVRVARAGDSDWILFGVIAEAIDLAALGLSYRTDLRVLVRKRTGAMIVTTEALGVIDDQALAPAEAQLIALQLRPHWEHYRQLHTAGDLGELTRACLRAVGAVSVREGSGWWFAPLAQQVALERLRRLIEELPVVGTGRPWMLVLGQLDVAATRRQLAQAAVQDFTTQLEAAHRDLADLAARPAGTVRAATVAARLAAYRLLKARVEVFADLLGLQQAQLQRGLDELAAGARAIVVHVATADAAEPPGAMLPLPAPVAAG
ncbi:MAG: hypothetical protein IT340_18085 [Chloroflexi bacterium]|nr:hypothetical protein [Chloroflexota bacterium]